MTTEDAQQASDRVPNEWLRAARDDLTSARQRGTDALGALIATRNLLGRWLADAFLDKGKVPPALVEAYRVIRGELEAEMAGLDAAQRTAEAGERKTGLITDAPIPGYTRTEHQ